MTELAGKSRPDIMSFAGMSRERRESWERIEKILRKGRRSAKMRELNRGTKP